MVLFRMNEYQARFDFGTNENTIIEKVYTIIISLLNKTLVLLAMRQSLVHNNGMLKLLYDNILNKHSGNS